MEITLTKFMQTYYKNANTRSYVVELLNDEDFLKQQGWERVFHEGTGEGVADKKNGIVAVFDEENLEQFHSVGFYEYDPNAWKDTANGGWDKIYQGDNGADFNVISTTVFKI